MKWLLYFFIFLMPEFIPAQNISTIAGTGTGGYNGDNIAATLSQLYGPQGLALDAAGNIYIADLVNSRVRKITISTGIITTIAGTGTPGYNGDNILAVNAQIQYPSALTFDTNGDLFFTDRGNSRVRKITTSTGIITTIAGTGAGGYNGDGIAATSAQLNNPNDVSFDASGNLHIADWQNNRVRKVDKITGIISTIAGTGVAGFNGDGLAATSSQINGPCGIIFDHLGNTFISEYGGYRIRKITLSTGLMSTIAGTGVAGYNGDGIAAVSAKLNLNAYIRFDGNENMYIGDAGNARVRKITTSTGIISTIGGTGTPGYNGDGIAATSAQLNAPFNICFDQTKCNTYIADYNNNRLRKITGGFIGCTQPVAPGNQVSCQALPTVTIDNSNNNVWVPIFDGSGNIAAEINGGTNNLGTINTSLYTKTGPCRQDASFRIYLNRNITFTVQNISIFGNVSIRLYILKAELDSLKTAMNSQGQPSGVATINDVDVFKNNDACATVGSLTASPLLSTPNTYNYDYYLQMNLTSFSSTSSFYFANKLLTSLLPVKVNSFTGTHTGTGNSLHWEVGCSGNIQFNIERGYDGIHFDSIGVVTTNDCNRPFFFTDIHPLQHYNYYRLKINETDGYSSYSSIILLQGNETRGLEVSVIPNFIGGGAMHVQVASENDEAVELIVTDMTGRLMYRKHTGIHAGSNSLSLAVPAMAPGMYLFYVVGLEGRSNVVKVEVF